MQKFVDELRRKGLGDTTIIVGGVIPAEDYAFLREAGVAEIFGPDLPASAEFREVVITHLRSLYENGALATAKETDPVKWREARAFLLRANAAAWSVGYIQQSAQRHGFVPGVVPSVVRSRGWAVSNMTASSSVRVAAMLFMVVPGCGPWGMPCGWRVKEPGSTPLREPKLPRT